MSDFVFVGSPCFKADLLLQSKLANLIAALGYQAEAAVAFETANGSMAARQFSRATNLYRTEEQCHVGSDGSISLLKGHLIHKGADVSQLMSARDIDEQLKKLSIPEFQAEISGDYGVCNFDAERARFFVIRCRWFPFSIMSLSTEPASLLRGQG